MKVPTWWCSPRNIARVTCVVTALKENYQQRRKGVVLQSRVNKSTQITRKFHKEQTRRKEQNTLATHKSHRDHREVLTRQLAMREKVKVAPLYVHRRDLSIAMNNLRRQECARQKQQDLWEKDSIAALNMLLAVIGTIAQNTDMSMTNYLRLVIHAIRKVN